MEDQKTFKERNLATAQKTMESLLAEKRKRERDLDLLRISEPKLLKELTNLKENISRMHRDMQVSLCCFICCAVLTEGLYVLFIIDFCILSCICTTTTLFQDFRYIF